MTHQHPSQDKTSKKLNIYLGIHINTTKKDNS